MSLTDEQIAAWLHGSLDAEEAARIEAQVAGDPALSARAERLRQMDSLVRQAVPLEEPLPAELLARLGLAAPAADNVISLALARADRAAANQARQSRFAVLGSGSWRVAAQVVLFLGVGVTAAQWLSVQDRTQPDAAYHALGDTPSGEATANALVMFNPGIDLAEARAIATGSGATVIGTPTSTGAWRLNIDPARRDAVLSELKAMPEVKMAEPIDGDAP